MERWEAVEGFVSRKTGGKGRRGKGGGQGVEEKEESEREEATVKRREDLHTPEMSEVRGH